MREIESLPVISKSFDGKHEIQFNEGSHRYKWTCPCHLKMASVGVTTFLKAAYPTSMGLISWMKGQTAEALFEAITIPSSNGYHPREGFWPISDKTKVDLIKEAKFADREVLQEAGDIGTILHTFAELYSLNKTKEAHIVLDKVRNSQQFPIIKKCIEKYLEWNMEKKGNLVLSETLVASSKHLFCGKIDRLDELGGTLILRDYKTSKAIFSEHKIQLALYRLAIKDWLGLDVKAIEIVRFGKQDGEFETELIDDPKTLKDLEDQGIRCRETYTFINQEKKSK